MVVSTMVLAVVILGGPSGSLANGPAAGTAALSPASAVSPHLVVPTGVAVPVARQDSISAPADLFRTNRAGRVPVTFIVGSVHDAGSTAQALLPGVTTRPFCRL